MKEDSNSGFFISGPKACATVYHRRFIEPVIAALCSETNDDPEDYTATDLDEV
jgi:hypothetical protein